MIVNKKPQTKIEIDLNGPQGNAFNLIGIARELARKTNLDETAITQEMMSGDYEHVVNTLEKYFGHIIIMYKSM